jgi:hypothetical protein
VDARAQMIDPNVASDKKERIDTALLKFCKLDILTMAEIDRFLEKLYTRLTMPKATVISDNELIEDLITALLIDRGYELTSLTPDLVILKQPDIFPIIQQIYQAPIILVSARVVQLRAQGIKPYAFLGIPFAMKELDDILKSLSPR